MPSAGDDDDDEPFDAVAYFNPYSGPPEGEDAWLAQVASPVADEYLARRQPSPPGREALAAGFTHRDPGEGARGFAAGGPLDIMEPGPVLAGFADDAISDGLAVLSDDELIGMLGAARKMASWAGGMELAAVSHLDARRAAHAAATGDSRQAGHVADEIAVALTLTCRAADRLLSLAAGVRRLPAVTGALAAGRIDMPKAVVFTDELAALGDVAAAAIAAVAVTDAAGLTTSSLREVLRRAVLAHDPGAARRRRRTAQQQARVECWAETCGTAALAGRDLPPAEALAADQRIDALARNLKAAGAGGTLAQLRAAVFLALLTGRPLYTLLPGNHPGDHWQDHGQDQDNRPGGGPGEENSPAAGGARPGTGQDDGRPADGSDHDNHAPGDDDPGDGDGNGGGARRPGPGTRPGGPGAAGFPGGTGSPAGLAGSVNLTVPLATWLGLSGHPGEAAGYGPLDAAASRDLAALLAARPGNKWCLTITGPGGQAAGHGCAATAPPGPGGPGPPRPGGPGPPGQCAGPAPPGPGTRTWLAGITIRWLETGNCSHSRQTRAYQPSPALRHLIKNRDRTCSFPGCRRSARRCDDDHTIPFDRRGRTCECNLSPLCRRHHDAKQAPGWHLEQPLPGTLTWTLPSGRQHTITPRTYAT